MKMKKIEWSAMLICEFVFGFDGVLFTVLGIIFGLKVDATAASPNSRGDVGLLPRIFCAVGILFMIIAAIMIFFSVKKKRIRSRLIESGRYINARVTEIGLDYSVRINGLNPYYVICEGKNPRTGEMISFRSADVTENPSYLLDQYLRVFVDFDDPRNYYVELERDSAE